MRCAVLFSSLVAVLFTASPGWSQTPTLAELAAQVSALQSTVDTLTRYIQVVETASTSSYHGLTGPHVIFTGANVHIRSGHSTMRTNRTNGLGNLIIGYNEANTRSPSDTICLAPPRVNPRCYNEANTRPPSDTAQRGGSHNLVIGQHHQYPNSGGLVAGEDNIISGYAASVSGGKNNMATGSVSSVSGGVGNTSSGDYSSVSGGEQNTARGGNSSVSGGEQNTAIGDYSSVSGGKNNEARGNRSSVSGGRYNEAIGPISSVSGGRANKARGHWASVSGGHFNEAIERLSSVSGGDANEARGPASSVIGGSSVRVTAANEFNHPPQVSALQTTVDTLTRYIQVVENAATSTYNGLTGPHVIFTGANVHIRNGDSTKRTATINGRGNLIVGYNEASPIPVFRDGSHNVVIGPAHEYGSHGGLVAGFGNSITGPYSSVSGGQDNMAIGQASSVSGGLNNWASGRYSSVSGGQRNTAGPDPAADASTPNQPTGESASVSGGHNNLASGRRSSISGGKNQTVIDDL